MHIDCRNCAISLVCGFRATGCRLVALQEETVSYQTVFGSLEKFEKGTIELVNDDAKHYVFSNIFEVANGAKPYEKVVVAKNLEYVIETLRAEGDSPWYAAAHDEFAVVMDGELEVHFVKLERAGEVVPAGTQGAVLAGAAPAGKSMGFVRLKRGHQALLPAGAAYQFRARRTGVVMVQTILGKLSVQKWADICYH